MGEIAISCDAPVAVPDLFGLTAAARAVMLLAEEHHVGFQSAAPASASTAAGVLGYVIFVAEGGTTLAVLAWCTTLVVCIFYFSTAWPSQPFSAWCMVLVLHIFTFQLHG